MLHVAQLQKSYGAIEALRGVDLDVEAGEIVALLGPNGAGKTALPAAVLLAFGALFTALTAWRFRFEDAKVYFG